MTRIQIIGATAAFLNALSGLFMLLVAVLLIGLSALSNKDLLAEQAQYDPTPLYIQDGLKFVAAAIALALIWALYQRLAPQAPALLKVAAGFGVFSAIFLIANACFSLYATSQAATFSNGQTGLQLNQFIGVLGLATIFINGPFYLIVSWVGLKTSWMPKLLNYLGLLMGGLSLLPFLAIFVLLFSLVWSVWLGFAFLRKIRVGDPTGNPAVVAV